MTPEQLQFLKSQGFPSGMVQALWKQKDFFPIRIWILDNSSFMNVRDADILRGNYQNVHGVSRWEELQDCVAYHANLAMQFQFPTRFSMLNPPTPPTAGPQYFAVAQQQQQTGGSNLQVANDEQRILWQVMTQTVPNGPTPLSAQLKILRDYVSSIAANIRAKNQTVSVVLATQGLPTDNTGTISPAVTQEFVETLRTFEQYPVWMVLRMCTDDERSMDFYNTLDAQIDLPFDVLDDFYGEALEIYLRNPWLTYGLVLHRYREMGFRVSVLDTLDERALTVHEIRDLCYFLFNVQVLPDPAVDWRGFLQAVEQCMAKECVHWNPIIKSASPWLNLAHLNELHGDRSNNPFAMPPAAGQPTSPPAQQRQQQVPSANRPASGPSSHPSPSTQQQSTNTPLSDSTTLVRRVDTEWGKQPPTYTVTKPIAELLGTIGSTFVLVESHEYFSKKFHPFSNEALANKDNADVLKRAVRKMRLFLHPDKLPKDFNERQTLLCRTLWDSISESWNAYKDGES